MMISVKKRTDTIKWLIVTFGLIIRFWRLGRQSFWADEILTIDMYRSPQSGVSYFRKFLWDVHGPLYSMILHFWSMISSSEFWLRTPSVLAGGLSVWFLHKWLKKITDERTALTGALFLAISPFSLYYSQELRFYAMLNLFVIFSLIAFRKFEIKPDAKSGMTLGLVLGLTCLAHFSTAFLCMGFLVYMVAARRLKGDYLRYGLLAAVIVIVIVSPWIYRQITFLGNVEIKNIANLSTGEKLRGGLTLNLWSYPYILYAFSTGYSLGPSLRELHLVRSGLNLIHDYGLELVVVYLLFGGMLTNAFVKLKRMKYSLFFFIVPVVAILCLTATVTFNLKVFNVRYLIVIFPIFTALLAVGVPKKAVGAGIVIACAATVMFISDFNYFMDKKYARDNIRGSVEIISRNETPGDIIILMGVYATFDHYYKGDNRNEKIFVTEANSAREIEKIEKIAGEAERVWLVKCRQWALDSDDPVSEVYSRKMREVKKWELSGIKLFLFEKIDSKHDNAVLESK
jgi:uncharacterized membrane protein